MPNKIPHHTDSEIAEIRQEAYTKPAGGLKAVEVALRKTAGEMGLVRGAKALLNVNQAQGFDCPGCAWPDPDHRAMAEFCENGAKAVAHEGTTRRVGPDFFAKWSISALRAQSDHWLEAQGRLVHPMVRRGDFYEPISWDDAFALIGRELNALSHPDLAAFYTSGRTSNEAAFLYQLFARRFGTNNLPDCSNMCHESSGVGLTEVLGVGKGTVTLADFDLADAIFIIGQNPGTNHPRMLSTLDAAARRGCHIVSINPLKERGLVRFAHPQHPLSLLSGGRALAEHFLQVRINGDVALLKGIVKEVLDVEAERPGHVLDWEFIRAHTKGFDAFAEDVRRTSWEEIEGGSGVSRWEIHQAAEIYARAQRVIVCWAMGLTQHRNAVDNIQAIVNLLLLRGNIGRPGAGACPVRGHSNVQGDRTMGIMHDPKPAFLNALARVFHFEPPQKRGLDTVDAIQAMHRGEAEVFIGLGGNFLSASPDTQFTTEALQRCRLTVQISTKLNRSHLHTGAMGLILPCLGRTERDVQASGPQFVSVENSMGIVHASQGNLTPASGQLLSEPAIVAGIARATLGEGIDWEGFVANYDRIRDAIEQVVPGFEHYNARVREPGGFVLPNGARERIFETSSGKAVFSVLNIPKNELKDGHYMMMTIRTHDQFNTTVYGLDDRYRGIYGERRVVLMNAEDMAEAGLSERQVVDVTSHFEGETRVAPRFIAMPYDIPRRCVATYFPEANVLVPIRDVARGSNTPASKSVVVSISPTAHSRES